MEDFGLLVMNKKPWFRVDKKSLVDHIKTNLHQIYSIVDVQETLRLFDKDFEDICNILATTRAVQHRYYFQPF